MQLFSAIISIIAYFGLLWASTYTHLMALVVIMSFAYSASTPPSSPSAPSSQPCPSLQDISLFLAFGSAGIVFAVSMSSLLKQYFDYSTGKRTSILGRIVEGQVTSPIL